MSDNTETGSVLSNVISKLSDFIEEQSTHYSFKTHSAPKLQAIVEELKQVEDGYNIEKKPRDTEIVILKPVK